MLITFTDEENLAAYLKRNRLPFSVVTDRDRAGYRAFGLGRGSVRRVWGWRAGFRYLTILRSGSGRFRRPIEDTLQLGGDFVVDADGFVTYAFRGSGPDDRPEVEAIVAAVRGFDQDRGGG